MISNGDAKIGVDLVYTQTMEAFRAIFAQSVSTAGVFATAAVAVVAVGVERQNPGLIAVSALFPLLIFFVFRRWDKIDKALLRVVEPLEERSECNLAKELFTWRRDAWLVNLGPLLAAVGLAVWALSWWIVT